MACSSHGILPSLRARAFPTAFEYISLQYSSPSGSLPAWRNRLDKHDSRLNRAPHNSIYGALDRKQRQFRLLRLVEDVDVLSYELRAFSLDDHPEYTALSYCWGSEDATDLIEIADQEFWVRLNLYECLATLAFECQHGWYFIDAICISQEAKGRNAEKDSQVQLMGSIYGQALEVVSWLGVITLDESKAIIDAVFFLATDPNALPAMDLNPQASVIAHTRWSQLRAIWRAPYWHRLWTTQEMLLARQLVFRFQCFSLPEAVLLDLCLLYYGVGPSAFYTKFWQTGEEGRTLLGSGEMINGFEQDLDGLGRMAHAAGRENESNEVERGELRAQHILELRELLRVYGRSSLNLRVTTCFNAFASQDCTEPRDKVFALLGLQHEWLHANYDMPMEVLYLHTLIEGFVEINFTVRDVQFGRFNEEVGFYETLRKHFRPLIGWKATTLPLLMIQELCNSIHLVIGTLNDDYPRVMRWVLPLLFGGFWTLVMKLCGPIRALHILHATLGRLDKLLLPYHWLCSYTNCQMPSLDADGMGASTYHERRGYIAQLLVDRISQRISRSENRPYRPLIFQQQGFPNLIRRIIKAALFADSPRLLFNAKRMVSGAFWEIDTEVLRNPSPEDEWYFADLIFSADNLQFAKDIRPSEWDEEYCEPSCEASLESFDSFDHILRVMWETHDETQDMVEAMHAAMRAAIDVRDPFSALVSID